MRHWLPLVVHLPAAGVAAATGALVWSRRHSTNTALHLVVIMACLTWWSLCDVAFYATSNPTIQTVAWVAIPPAVATAIASYLALTLSLTRRSRRLTPRLVAFVALHPTVVTLAAVTSPWHQGFGRPTGDLTWHVGPLFWAHAAYSYLVLGITLTLLFRGRRRARGVYRGQLTSVLLCATLPTVGDLLTLAQGENPVVDLGPVFFVATGVWISYALFRQGLFQLVPVAREHVVDTMGDAVMVVDLHDRVIDINPAATRLARTLDPSLPHDLIGSPVQRLVERWAGAPLREGQVDVELDGHALHLDVRLSALMDRCGDASGTVVVIRDLTELQRQRRELAEANARLQRQVETIEQLRCELAEQASRDVLTGLHNRRHLIDVLREEVARATTGTGTLSVVLLDLDRFKTVNDRHGHAVGDDLLVRMGAELAAMARPGDTVARYGGEEFVAVLPATSPQDAYGIVEALRQRFAAIRVPSRHGSVSTTLSAGIATFSRGDTPETLLEAADQALYEAKASGRDRVEMAPGARHAMTGGRAGL